MLLSGEPQSGATRSSFHTLHALRIRYDVRNSNEHAFLLHIPISEQQVPHALEVSSDGTITGWGRSSLTLSGPEGCEFPFLHLLGVSGWKLDLTQEGIGAAIHFQFTARAQWPLDAPPQNFPGPQAGELIIASRVDAKGEAQGISVSIPWPFTYAGVLRLVNPRNMNGEWQSGMDPEGLNSVLEATGPVLRSTTMGLIDVKTLAEKLVAALDADSSLGVLEDFLYFTTRETNSGFPEFELQLETPAETELAEFGSMRLILLGQVALALKGTLEGEYLDNAFEFRLQGETNGVAPGLRLEGPLVRQFQGALSAARTVTGMLPTSLDLPELPEIKLEYRFHEVADGFSLPHTFNMGRFKLPARWDAQPTPLNSGLSFLEGLPLSIPKGVLDKFQKIKLGDASGESPGVELLIQSVTQEETPTARALNLNLNMQLTIALLGEEIKLFGEWRMEFNWETLAFDPAAGLQLSPESKKFSIGDLHIEGLNTLSVEWGAGQLSLKASSLRAYYSGISEEGDDARGFEFLITNLLIDSGGIDIDLELVGGTPKVAGIGEAFKGAAGAISFRRSVFEFGYITAEGPLPWLDNATGSITLTFGRGFKLQGVQGEFQLGVHHKTDWWVEIDLKAVGIELDFSRGKNSLILMITGKLGLKPPEGAGGIFKYFKEIELEFKDLVLTKSFDRLPAGLSLNVVLDKPFNISFLDIFDFEIRSLGIGSGFDPGGAALSLGGQIFFSSNDLANTDPEYHKFKIGSPSLDSFMPRFALENLPFDVSLKPTLHASGKVQFRDNADWKGFIGSGTLTINGNISITCVFEFSNKRRQSDGTMLRVWMVYAEWLNFDMQLLGDFYLRDIGMGFGWRKTLKVLNDPLKLLSHSFDPAETFPHKAEAWEDDLESDPARWTVVMSAWLTLGNNDRKKVSELVGNILLALRSDLTVLLLVRAWIFNALDDIKNGPAAKNPPVIGMVYYSPPMRHLIAALIVQPGTPPKGVSPAMVKALIGDPFTFILETKPGLFRLELGNPRQLSFPLGAYTGRAGFFFRKAPGSLTIGVSFEIAIDRQFSYGISFGIASLSIHISVYVGIWGLLAMRIGSLPALYGEVGVFALVNISLRLNVNFRIKIGWVKITIRFSIGYSIQLSITAMVAFGVSNAGFGMRGEAQASLRIWKFSFSAAVSFSMGAAALDEARRRVFEGTSMAGDELTEPERYLPEPVFNLASLDEGADQKQRWSVLHCIIGEDVFVLLLPEAEEGSWLATPAMNIPDEANVPEAEDDEVSAVYRVDENIPDYTWYIELDGATLESHPEEAQSRQGNLVVLEHTVNWNAEVPFPKNPDPAVDENESPFTLGDLFFESTAMKEEYQILQHGLNTVLKDRHWKPELIEDERVRSEETATDPEYSAGLRPDVRSPHFAKDTGYYDLALAEAFRYPRSEALSWQAMSLAYTNWADDVISSIDQEGSQQGHAGTSGRRIEFLLDGVPLSDGMSNKAKRLNVLQSIGNFEGKRSGALSNLVREFSTWVEANRKNTGDTPKAPGEFLQQTGLAFRFRLQQNRQDDFRIRFQKGVINGSAPQTVNAFHNSTLTPTTPELGFSRDGHTYRIVDLLEFQDENGIHFSWVFELITPRQEHIAMSHREASGLYAQHDWFEHFDHYRIERENLAGDNRENNQVNSWTVKPAYVPAYLQTDVNEDGSLPNRKLFVVAPRFDFSDLFESPTQVGDPLIYRITAVDLFGNTSQTTEWYTTRKELTPPPPPEKGRVEHLAWLAQGEADERFELQITENRNLSKWNGGPLTYEVWTRSFPLTSSGYYGAGNDAGEEATDADQSSNSTDGMTLAIRLPEGETIWKAEDTATLFAQLDYGRVHAFFVRSVSREGNASRLMRCEHYRWVGKAGKESQLPKLCGYLERIPPPDEAALAWQWLSLEELRQEVRPLSIPALIDPSQPDIDREASPDVTARELTLRLLHKPWLDAGARHPKHPKHPKHPTGGYKVFVRDLDTTLEDHVKHFKAQARIEVVSPFRYAFSPPNSTNPQQWAFPPSATVAEGEYYQLNWGWSTPGLLSSADFLASAPEGMLVHPDLGVLLRKMLATAEEHGLELHYTGGLCQASRLGDTDLEALIERFGPEADPGGSALLKWMGRSVDLYLLGAEKHLGTAAEVHQWITGWLGMPDADVLVHEEAGEDGQTDHYSANMAHHTILIERLLNSDRETDMGYFRLSLLPRMEAIEFNEQEDEAAQLLAHRNNELTAFADQLRKFFPVNALPAEIEVNEETVDLYQFLIQSLVQRHRHHAGRGIGCGLSWLLDAGEMVRPLQPDATLSVQMTFMEPYAKRLAYRVLRVSRYQPLYVELGLAQPAGSDLLDSDYLRVRLPRVKPPRIPTVQFLGNFDRGDILCSEWLMREHEEEALVQSNETYRNRLGYRGLAWSLFCAVKEGWRQRSGWDGSETWDQRSSTPDDTFLPGLSEAERQQLNTDAAWEGESMLPPDAGLAGHPFTELLKPKGTVIRVPVLPYYYDYRLAAFSRSDDVDSAIRLTDASPAFPSVLPQVDLDRSGWEQVGEGAIRVWWRIPSAWESLSEAQQELWVNERPFADRLWDGDIAYTLQIAMQSTLIPLAVIKPCTADDKGLPENVPLYRLHTPGKYLYLEQPRPEQGFLYPTSPFWPELSITFKVTEKFKPFLNSEDNFLDIVCSRSYGTVRQTDPIALIRKLPPIPELNTEPNP